MSELFQSQAKELNKHNQYSGSSSTCTASLITRLVRSISTRRYIDYDDNLLVLNTIINFSAFKLRSTWPTEMQESVAVLY